VERFADLLIAPCSWRGCNSTWVRLGLIYGVLRIVNLNHGGMIIAGALRRLVPAHALVSIRTSRCSRWPGGFVGVGILIYRLLGPPSAARRGGWRAVRSCCCSSG